MFDVKVDNLSFAYPDDPEKLILSDINMDVKKGEFVCLLGQSGCGKSTFLRLMAGLETPTAGSILIDGEEVDGASLDRSVVFQDYGLFPWMTAGANIMLAIQQKYPKYSKDKRKEITMNMLEAVGLGRDVFSKLPKELSGGMKQRCAIAQSFSIDSPILLMDEPFGALDAVTRARLQDMVLELWAKDEEKKTVFFVTHDVDEAMLLASRVFVFGQKPSHILYDCKVPEGITDRSKMSDNPEFMRIRNELIGYINRDVSSRVEE